MSQLTYRIFYLKSTEGRGGEGEDRLEAPDPGTSRSGR